MPLPFNLSVLLTPPPNDSPPASLASMTIQVGQQGRVYSGGVLADPLTPDEQDELTW
jgi:hypothetical protein